MNPSFKFLSKEDTLVMGYGSSCDEGWGFARRFSLLIILFILIIIIVCSCFC
ncbi:sporulation protein YjcZ [Bacillus cereus]|nr:sporulation protein YjcZ [Bacillus cereus]PFD49369.1 sporulation protein YjcZ [Bacillus cereus]PFH83757.1 sporulation protein YjcZ [Bacillus cereus]